MTKHAAPIHGSHVDGDWPPPAPPDRSGMRRNRARITVVLAGFVAAWLALSAPAEARIVVLQLELPVDRIGEAASAGKIGDVHHARIFYDDAKIDPKTHVARVLHMQHEVGPGNWIPARLDPVYMPMGDAWIDLSRKPYGYHYRSKIIEITGEADIIDFDETTARMTISHQSDGSLILSAPYHFADQPVTGVDVADVWLPPPAYIVHDVDVALDTVVAGEPSKVGDHDKVRIAYDYSAIDPKTHRVKLLNLQHFIGGKYNPEHPDAVMMPMNDAWLDVGSLPYRMHFRAAVTHGKPIIIEVDDKTRRLTIRSAADQSVLESGPYVIDPTPLTGPEAVAAATVPSRPRPANAGASAAPTH